VVSHDELGIDSWGPRPKAPTARVTAPVVRRRSDQHAPLAAAASAAPAAGTSLLPPLIVFDVSLSSCNVVERSPTNWREKHASAVAAMRAAKEAAARGEIPTSPAPLLSTVEASSMQV
jgi:hypothetical protein